MASDPTFKALPAYAPATERKAEEPVHYHSDFEVQLIKLWKEILGADIQPTDNVFDRGATSFEIIRFVNSAQALHGGKIRVSDLYNFGTIRELVLYLAGPVKEKFEAFEL